jgi:phosphoglucomutase
MEKNIQIKVDKWLNGNYDDETKNEIRNLTINNEKELIDSFYKELEFGTGGLRGIMGAGTNRMNKYTVGAAAQGLSNYIIKFFGEKEKIKVAVAYDSRNNSRFFAETVSNIFSANGFEVFLFDALRPTPELSFAVRYLNCKAGVVITASHNPKEYNGFKAYWNDGGQIVPPHDKNIIVEVNKISEIEQIKFEAIKAHIYIIGEEIDNIYLKKIKELSISPEIIEKNSDLKIVYTAIHGSGVNLVPKVLKNFGFKNVYTVKEQDISDGNFPTVNSPNPENADALEMAVNLAKEIDADLVLATDPDADRVGIAVKDNNEKFILLNGNQTASVLIYYLIKKKFENNLLKGNEYIVKTIVTSELLVEIAKKYKVEYFDVLTGFKYIAEIIKENEGKKLFIGGGEESYGYLAGEFVRDKDAVMASALIAETAAWAKENGKSFYEQLIEIYVEFGFFKETLVNIVKKGKEGAEEIKKMMSDYRKNHLVEIAGMKVVEIKDYLIQESVNMINGTKSPINLPKADVIQFFIEDGTKVTVRPSGTEPKIKFYIGLKETLNSKEDFEEINKIADEKLNNIKKSLNLL